jgi:hypothetical protein
MKGKIEYKRYNTSLLTLLRFFYFYRQGTYMATGIPIISPSSGAIEATPCPHDFRRDASRETYMGKQATKTNTSASPRRNPSL